MPLARWHWQARLAPGQPRRRPPLGLPARVCLRLRSPFGAACPARFGGRQFNIMLGIMRSAKNALSGSRHAVITGVAVLCPRNVRLLASETTYVTMRRMTAGEIDDYIRSDEWRGKAGAYAIQETADRYIVKVEGSFTNVVGLPMELVARMLAELRRRPEAHRAI